MVVFLVGGESRLMDALITKMEKDGHKTYLLTGKRDEEESTAAYLNGTISRTTARASAKSFQT